MRPLCAFKLLTLAFALTTASFAEAPAAYRLDDAVRPISQAVHLTLDSRENTYVGHVSIQLEVRQSTDHFRFHSEGHQLRRVELTDKQGVLRIEHTREGADRVHVRVLEGTLAAGSYTLVVDFEAVLGTRATGLYRVEQDGYSYAFTQFQPADARQAFPCWDEPRFKIPFQLTLTVPEGHLTFTNSPEKSASSADGWRTVVFRRSKPLPTYALTLATGPFETVRLTGLGLPGRVVMVRGRSHLAAGVAETVTPVLRALEDYFARPYPYEKLDLIAVPEFSRGAMESPGAVAFAEDLLLLDPESAAVTERQNRAYAIAHELAHMWFGNLVTLTWWDELWLNESFATWMGYQIAQQVFPRLRVDVLRRRQAQLAMRIDARTTSTPIRRDIVQPDEAFVGSTLTYEKGSEVLGMFEHWVGAEAFRRGVNAYLEAHAWGNATAEDFWQAIDRSSGKKVSTAIATFIEQPGFPLIDVELLDGRLRIGQQRFTALGTSAESLTWRLPVTLKYRDGGGARTQTVLLETPSRSVALTAPGERSPEPEWILPNAAASSYFRWSLGAEQLIRLAAIAGEELTAGERLGLVSNTEALLSAGKLSGDTYLELLGKLADDSDPAVVSALVDALDAVKKGFVTPQLEDAFAAYLRRILSPPLRRFGLEPAADEDPAIALVRGRLYLQLGRDGREPSLRRHARELVRSLLGDSQTSSVSVAPELIGPAWELAALDGDRELFDAYRKRFAAADPTERQHLVAAMGSFPGTGLRQLVLDDVLRGNLRTHEFWVLAGVLFADAEGKDLFYRWMKDHYDALKEWMAPYLVPYLTYYMVRCSTERLAQVEAFFTEPSHHVAGIENQLAQVAEKVHDCDRLRRREGGAVVRYLTTTAKSGVEGSLTHTERRRTYPDHHGKPSSARTEPTWPR